LLPDLIKEYIFPELLMIPVSLNGVVDINRVPSFDNAIAQLN